MSTASRVTSRVKSRRGLVWLAVVAAAAIASGLSVWRLQSAPAASPAAGVAEATRGDVILTVGGVGRVVPAGASAEIALPTAGSAGAAASGSAPSGSAASGAASAPTATSPTSVFPRTSGHLVRFLVKPGQRVAAGQPLALLDDGRASATAYGQARNDVATAMLELRQKRTNDPLRGLPPEPAELAAAGRAVTSARMRLARLLQGPRPADVSTAKLEVRRAEADLETLLGGTADARAEAVLIAQQNIQLAQERLDLVLAPPSAADVAVAQADVRKAESDLAVLLKPDKGSAPEEITAARAALDAARLKLAKLLGPPNPADVTAARLELSRAQAEERRLQAGPAPAALAAARQAVNAARARLAQLVGPPLPSDVTAARLDVLRAAADLAVLRARGGPASPLDVALARLKVVAAQLRLGSARVARPLLKVRAPSAGSVTELLTVRGAPVDPLTPIASVTNLDHLAVNIDLSEFDLARVKRGQRAVVSVDALGGKSFPGKVLFAALTGSNTGSVVTFPVRVGLAHAKGLRPGMSVSVRIIVAKRLDVVQVPLEAVSRDEEDHALLTVIDASGESTPRRVTLGLSNNKNVEIVKGLRAGERVELPESQGQGGQEE
jgi:HlyD family secretion protein